MGLSSRSMVRRLRAWHLGEPITLGQTVHTKTAGANERMLLAFVKMGGETRPWGVAWKLGGKQTQFRSVPEPRMRADVDEMIAELGAVLAHHFQHPAFTDPNATEAEDLAPYAESPREKIGLSLARANAHALLGHDKMSCDIIDTIKERGASTPWAEKIALMVKGCAQ